MSGIYFILKGFSQIMAISFFTCNFVSVVKLLNNSGCW